MNGRIDRVCALAHPSPSALAARRRALATLAGAAALAATGCVNVDLGTEAAATAQFVLLDRSDPASAAPRLAPVAAALLVQAEAGDPLADSLAMAYSRQTGERATYQLATWSDRPARRLPQLLLRRLEARGSVGAVALLGQPLAADWLLGLAIDDIVHDLAREPGQARLVVRASLYDRRARRQVAQQAFRVELPVSERRPAAFAAAMSDAASRVLDQLAPWTEQQIVAARGAAPGGGRDARP